MTKGALQLGPSSTERTAANCSGLVSIVVLNNFKLQNRVCV